MTHQTPSSKPESSANKEASGDRLISTCSLFLAAAEEIERVAPVTAEDLMRMSEVLPPLEGDEAKIALAVIAALISLHGRVRREYALGVASGVKRCGGAAALLKACRENWRAGNMAEASRGIERAFGARYAKIGCYLSGSNVLDEADRILSTCSWLPRYRTRPLTGYARTNNEGFKPSHKWHPIYRKRGESNEALWKRLGPHLLNVDDFPKDVDGVHVIAAVEGFLVTLDPRSLWPVLHPSSANAGSMASPE